MKLTFLERNAFEITEKTVVTHINNIYQKTSLKNMDYKVNQAARLKIVLYYLKHIGVLNENWHIRF